MIISEQKIITLTYEVRDGGAAGSIIERMDLEKPFKFLFGTGKLLPTYEAELAGLKEDDNFDFTLAPEQAYGLVQEGNMVEVPAHVFQESEGVSLEKLQDGQFISLTDDQGRSHNGKILSRSAEAVKVDFNHALAGKTLHFKGTILTIRKATVDELVRGNYIEEDELRTN